MSASRLLPMSRMSADARDGQREPAHVRQRAMPRYRALPAISRGVPLRLPWSATSAPCLILRGDVPRRELTSRR